MRRFLIPRDAMSKLAHLVYYENARGKKRNVVLFAFLLEEILAKLYHVPKCFYFAGKLCQQQFKMHVLVIKKAKTVAPYRATTPKRMIYVLNQVQW